MHHTESQFVFQTGDDLEIRVREPNGCGFELVLLRHSSLSTAPMDFVSLLTSNEETWRRQLIGIVPVSSRYRLSKNVQ